MFVLLIIFSLLVLTYSYSQKRNMITLTLNADDFGIYRRKDYKNYNFNSIQPFVPKIVIFNKIKSYGRLIRAKNIFPTSILSLSGYLMGYNGVFQVKQLLFPMCISILIMCNSMIINYLFDYKLDNINNPTRPIVTQEITKKEAIIFSCILTTIIFFINQFLSSYQKLISTIALCSTFIYTPILKKIPVIKNLFCSSLVSFSVYFTAHSSNNNLFSLIRIIFVGSLINEILLDILDLEGDSIMGIKTIPGIIGKFYSIMLCQILLFLAIFWNIISCLHIPTFNTLTYVLLYIPSFLFFRNITRNNFSKQLIKKTVSNSSITLFLSCIYFIILNLFHL